MTNDQRAWAAGFVESGGQIGPWKGGVSLRIMRKDPDPLYRLLEITGVGEVLEPNGDKMERFSYMAFGDEVVELLRVLRPVLGHSWLERAGAMLHRTIGAELQLAPATRSKARRWNAARATVRRLRQEGIAAPETAWRKLETALARGNVKVAPVEYLARIVRFEETGEYVTTQLPDDEELEARVERAT